MSGRNQHHFWQVMQRGFGVERKQDFTTVFVYQKDKAPFPVGTRNFGAERDFFDFAPGSGADIAITRAENELQSLIRNFQCGEKPTDNLSASIADLISHLETRTKFFRQHLAETTSNLIGDLHKWLSSPKIFRKMIGKYASDNPERIDALLATEIEDPVIRAALAEFIIENISRLDHETIRAGSEDASKSLMTIAENILDIAKESHIKALLSNTPQNPRRNRYLDLNYRIRSNFDERLICPDTMVSFLTTGKPKPFLDMNDRLQAVWVPLTSNLMLIGEKNSSVECSNDTVLRILASTSYSSFIAKADILDLRKLSHRIGKNARIISNADIAKIKRSVLKELL